MFNPFILVILLFGSPFAICAENTLSNISQANVESLPHDLGDMSTTWQEIGKENYRIYFLRNEGKSMDEILVELSTAGYQVTKEQIVSTQVTRADAVVGVPISAEDYQPKELRNVFKVKITGREEKIPKGIFRAKWSTRPVWEVFYIEQKTKSKKDVSKYEYVYGKGYIEEKPPIFGNWEPTTHKLRIPGGLIGQDIKK